MTDLKNYKLVLKIFILKVKKVKIFIPSTESKEEHRYHWGFNNKKRYWKGCISW